MSMSVNDSGENKDMYLPIFPEPIDGEIPTADFLTASKQVLKVLDYFGKTCMPFKYDLEINIDKLTKKFNLDNESNSTLQKMLLKDKKKMENHIVIEAGLWLQRILHMIQLFFEYIVNDFESGKGSEDLVACLDKSYEQTLEPYHGYTTQQLFGLLSRMTPTRTEILRRIANGYDVKQEVVIKSMDRFSKSLKEILIILKDFYDEHNLDNNSNI